MRVVRILLAVCAFATLASGASAQSLTGKWTAHYPMRIRNENGQFSSDTGIAVVTLEQKGDSVSGTWLATNTPVPSKLRTFVGTFKDGTFTVTGSPVEAKINRGGDEETIQMITYFEAKLVGDKLVGTMHSDSMDGAVSSPPMEWTAERAKE